MAAILFRQQKPDGPEPARSSGKSGSAYHQRESRCGVRAEVGREVARSPNVCKDPALLRPRQAVDLRCQSSGVTTKVVDTPLFGRRDHVKLHKHGAAVRRSAFSIESSRFCIEATVIKNPIQTLGGFGTEDPLPFVHRSEWAPLNPYLASSYGCSAPPFVSRTVGNDAVFRSGQMPTGGVQ